ncbi:MAG: hypothetical protein H6673_09765 [Anaerolineales bacterium]|nr:hypothetical protein [Anaerolineales bacterium]
MSDVISIGLFKSVSSFLEILGVVSSFVHNVPFLPKLGRTGSYEVLEHETRLELMDVEGKVAVYEKRQQVRFVQDNIIAIQDKAWGVGEIFADYQCSPGVAVDRYKEGHRYRVLISLRQTKNKGDIENIYIRRAIKNGFTRHSEDIQTEVDHYIKNFRITVVFPSQRPPIEVSLVRQNSTRTTILGQDHIHRLADGRYEVRWETRHPRVFEAYIMAWKW